MDSGRAGKTLNATSEEHQPLSHPDDAEDERLADDQINPGLDREDAEFLDGRDFLDSVDEFIAEWNFIFLKPDLEDLKEIQCMRGDESEALVFARNRNAALISRDLLSSPGV